MLLLILLILMRRKVQEYKKRLEQNVEDLEDINIEQKEIFIITLDENQISNQDLS